MPDLTNQLALVTGAAGGIGRAISIALSQLGATVLLLGRDQTKLDALAAEIPGKAIALPCDLADDAQLASLPQRIRQLTPAPVDILIHSAAAYAQSPLESAPVADFDLQYRINLRAPFLLTQTLLPQLKRRPGQVVFINSTTGVNPRPGVTQYAATKHGLRGLADCFRAEIRPAGVRVISVYPGQTATDMQRHRHAIEGMAYHPEKLIQPQDVASAVINALTLPPTAEITDLHIRPFQK